MTHRVPVRPTLLNSCSRAATAAETAFRIDYPLASARQTPVVALDAPAAAIARAVASLPWSQARFFTVGGSGPEIVELSGASTGVATMLEGADSLVLVAATGENALATADIGAACVVRGIMTAGLVVAPGPAGTAAVLSLRPHARILMFPAEEDDLIELLTAIRA